MPRSAAFVAVAVVVWTFAPGALLLSLSAQAQPATTPAPVPAIASSETEKLLALEGQTVRVTGRVESTGTSKSGNQFLNFAGSTFVAITFASDLAKFPDGAPADVFDGKTVAITGPIKIYKGIPEIILSQPSLIAIIDPADAVVPEPAPVPEIKEGPPAPDPEPAAAPEPPKAELEKPARVSPVDWRQYFPE